MDSFGNLNSNKADGGGDGNGNVDDFSLDRIDSLNDPLLSLHPSGRFGDLNFNEETGGGMYNEQEERTAEVAGPFLSVSQFSNLNLQSGSNTSTRAGERAVEIDDEDEDPFAALEAAIEEDKPKTEPSPEWQKMLDAIQTEENEQQPGAPPAMVPNKSRPPSNATATATAPTTGDDVLASTSSPLDEDIDLDAPILLHPTENDNNTINAYITSNIDVEDYSPSQVLTAAGQEISEATEGMSSESGGSGGGGDLAGNHSKSTPTPLSEDPAQEIEDIRRRSFAALQPICSTLLTHRNNPTELCNALTELKAVLLKLQAAGVQSCVDYVIFPLQVALDGITATRGGGGESGTTNLVVEEPPSSTSTTTTTAALPALRSDKTAEAALSALLVLLQRGTRCTSGDQLLSLLHRLCGVLALPREAISEEIRLGTLQIITAALVEVPYDTALQSAVREESAAPLIGHLGSVLVKTAAAEVDAGGTGSKRIRIEALRSLKMLIQAVNCAEALSFFLPGLVTGLARALLVAGGGGGGGGKHRSQGPAASGAAAVEALQGLTSLLKATLGNESVANILNMTSSEGTFYDSKGVTTTAGAVGAGADAVIGHGSSSSTLGTLTGDAALAELSKLAQKSSIGPTTTSKEERFDQNMEIIKTLPSQLPQQQQPSQPGEAPNLRVDRTEEWVRATAARIEEMLATVLPPLARDSRPADVREALVHACVSLSTDCSLALSGCLPVLTDIILALAQDSWPTVAAAARSSLNTTQTASATATAPAPSSSASPSSFSFLPILATAESSLKTWMYDLPAALRRGDEVGKAHALKITTCLEACSPQWIASQLLSHSTEASRLVTVLAECFAVDGDSAGLLLVAAPEAAGTGAFTESPGGAGGAPSEENGASSSTSTSVSVLLPRMPLSLQLISTQKTYECVANMVRTLAAVAVAADSTANISSNINSKIMSSGTTLRSLIDGCIQHIQRLLETVNSSDQKGPSRPGDGVKKNKKKENSTPIEIDSVNSSSAAATDVLGHPISWTISAAQMVLVLTEILFGASPAWQPKYTTSRLSSPTPAPSSSAASFDVSSSSSSNKELEDLIALVLPELVDTRIWNLPTSITSTAVSSSSSGYDDVTNDSLKYSHSVAALPSSSAPGLTAKDRGSNALLQRAVLDCIGTSARALGPRFTSNGRLLRFILLPVIQKMGDLCRVVAAAADTTIQAICTFCGYAQTGGLRQLVADNADYIVDGLCRQLRQPELFPTAPELFAALLRQGGVAPGLVPLLAEPARQALLGISIVARRKKPEHVLSFVLCLREISRGAGLVAQETCGELENFVALVAERRELLLEKIKEKEKEDKLSKVGVVEEITTATITSTEEENKNASSDSKMEEINKYFKDYRAKKKNALDPNNNNNNEEDTEEEIERDLKVPILLEEWNQIQILRKKAVSCATLAQSATDTAGPLILSSSLPVAIQSIKTCSQALEALKYASRGVEICAKHIDSVILPPGGVIGPTPDLTTAAFLPSVHLLWTPLMGALSDWRVAVVESVLFMLSHVSQLAGSFLTRRFNEEAWPVMQWLLLEGPSQKRIIAPGQDELSSPAVVQRAQRAVLACLRAMATVEDGSSEGIISPIAGPALVAVADLMGEKHPAVIREHATTAFVALSSVDPDAAWGLLVAAIRSSHSAAATAEKVVVMMLDKETGTFSSSNSSSYCPVGLPSMSEICPAPPSSADKYVPKGLRTCGETKLLALMRQVNSLPVPWHSDIVKLPAFRPQKNL